MRSTRLWGFVLCSLLSLSPAAAQQLDVDCDAGDDLAAALELAADSGLTWISVAGTCEGNFELDASVNVRIEGRDATLASPDGGVALRIAGSGFVTLEGFEVRSGSIGVQTVGPDVWAILSHCDVHENGYGTAASRGARLSVNFTVVHDNDLGMFCDGVSDCLASFATIRDNLSGVRVEGRSRLRSFGTEIAENGGGGVVVLGRSTADFDGTAMRENGPFHLGLTDRSHAFLENGSRLGGPGDGTPLALAVGLMSSASTSRFGDLVELHGNLVAADSAYLVLDTARVSGDVEIVDFAKLKLANSVVDGSVVCRSGGDAVCGEGSSARISGCAAARPNCAPHPSDQQPRHGDVLERIDRPGLEDASVAEPFVPWGQRGQGNLRRAN